MTSFFVDNGIAHSILMDGCSKKFCETAGVTKLSICGNCYFILTLLGVCHETVAFFTFKYYNKITDIS